MGAHNLRAIWRRDGEDDAEDEELEIWRPVPSESAWVTLFISWARDEMSWSIQGPEKRVRAQILAK